MNRSITIASGKGGTGKTAIAANLGVALAQLGKDTTILDADIEMANLGLHLGHEGIDQTLHDVLTEDAELEDVIYECAGGLKVIPAGISVDGLKKVDPDKMKKVLNDLLSTVDILIIDAPAGLGKNVITAIAAAQEALLVVNPEISAVSDALKTKIVAKKLGAHILGAILNRVSFDISDLTVEEVESVLETKIISVIPEDPEIRRSSALGRPVIVRKPGSPASISIRKLAAEIADDEYAPLEEESKGLVDRLTSGIFGKI